MVTIIRAEEQENSSLKKLDFEMLSFPAAAKSNRDEQRRQEEYAAHLARLEEMKKSILTEAQQQAQDILKKARTQADQIIQDANRKTKEIHEEARRQGYQEGFDKGMADGIAQAETRIEELESAMINLIQPLSTLVSDVAKQKEHELVQLLMFTAEKLAMKELSLSREAILDIARQALSRLKSPRVVLKASHQLIGFLREHREEFLRELESLEELRIELDDSLDRFDLIAETDHQVADASLSERLTAITNAIEAAYATGN